MRRILMLKAIKYGFVVGFALFGAALIHSFAALVQ